MSARDIAKRSIAGPPPRRHLTILSDLRDDFVEFRFREQLQRGRPYVSLGPNGQEKRGDGLIAGGFRVDDEVIRAYGENQEIRLERDQDCQPCRYRDELSDPLICLARRLVDEGLDHREHLSELVSGLHYLFPGDDLLSPS